MATIPSDECRLMPIELRTQLSLEDSDKLRALLNKFKSSNWAETAKQCIRKQYEIEFSNEGGSN